MAVCGTVLLSTSLKNDGDLNAAFRSGIDRLYKQPINVSEKHHRIIECADLEGTHQDPLSSTPGPVQDTPTNTPSAYFSVFTGNDTDFVWFSELCL